MVFDKLDMKKNGQINEKSLCKNDDVKFNDMTFYSVVEITIT